VEDHPGPALQSAMGTARPRRRRSSASSLGVRAQDSLGVRSLFNPGPPLLRAALAAIRAPPCCTALRCRPCAASSAAALFLSYAAPCPSPCAPPPCA
jgi:hypothetical protein